MINKLDEYKTKNSFIGSNRLIINNITQLINYFWLKEYLLTIDKLGNLNYYKLAIQNEVWKFNRILILKVIINSKCLINIFILTDIKIKTGYYKNRNNF